MGGCFSWLCKCKGDQENETTRLLASGGSAGSRKVRKRRFLSDSLPDVGDEDSAYNKILQEAAEEFLDVHTLFSSDYDHEEFVDRMNEYDERVNEASLPEPARKGSFLKQISAPDKLLSARPVRAKDFLMIKNSAKQVRSASLEIKVQHKENIVAPFQSY